MGGSILHFSLAKKHLDWKLQPDGRLLRSGGLPGIASSLVLRELFNLGTDLSSPKVYGCLGEW